jgi:hypothetical protein
MNASVPLSGLSQVNEIICYHEAGHAVMAYLMGREVQGIILTPNVENTYNGETKWGRNQKERYRYPDVPYDELGFKPEDNTYGNALVDAAGKAAERLWYRQRNLDETLASFGLSSIKDNDESLLEQELLKKDPQLKQEQLSEAKQFVENFAIKLLEFETCWQAVDTVAKMLLERLQEKPQVKLKLDIASTIFGVFRQAALKKMRS